MRKKISVLTILFVQILWINPVFGRVYLTKEEALKIAFPETESVGKKIIWFKKKDLKEIGELTGRNFRTKRMTFYIGKREDTITGYAVIDNVIGKKEFITYMVVLDPAGKVKIVEILAFRESQGYEIENKRWRDQFTGKTSEDFLRLKKDIVNISGATLSCRSITRGVKKIISVFEVIFKG